MELLGAGIEHVGSLRGGLRAGSALQPALAGGVVDLHPGLDVVDVDKEADALAVVLHTLRLHGHAAGNQILAVIDGTHPVEDVVLRLLDVVRDQILKGQHALHVQIAGAGDEVLLVGVLAGELVADEVAAVIEVLAVHAVILYRLPAGGLHLSDGPPLLRRHQVHAHAGGRLAAAAQLVQGAVDLVGIGGHLPGEEGGLIAVDLHIGFAGVGRELVQGNHIACPGRLVRFAPRQQQAPQHQQQPRRRAFSNSHRV